MVQIQQKLVIDANIAEQILELKEQLDSLMETIEILNSPAELNMLKQARMDVKKGRTIPFKKFLIFFCVLIVFSFIIYLLALNTDLGKHYLYMSVACAANGPANNPLRGSSGRTIDGV